MKHIRVIAVVTAATLLVACSGTPKVDIPTEEGAVRALSAHWLELENAHDAMGAAALFADNGVRYRAHREPATGVVAIEAAATKDYSDNPKAVMDWTADTVIVAASGDLAVELGTYAFTHAGLSGSSADRGHFVTVYRKLNGQWKIASGMGATANPEARPVAPRVVLASAAPRARATTVRKSRPVSHVVAKKSAVRKPVAKSANRSVVKSPAKRPTKATAKRSVAGATAKKTVKAG